MPRRESSELKRAGEVRGMKGGILLVAGLVRRCQLVNLHYAGHRIHHSPKWDSALSRSSLKRSLLVL